VQQAPGTPERLARIGELAGERHATVQVRSRGALAQLAEEPLALGAHRSPGDRQVQARDPLRRARDRLEGEVGPLPADQRAEQQHLGVLGPGPVGVVVGQVDARADHRQALAQAAVRVEVAADRRGVDAHTVGARDGGAHQPRHRRVGQEVDVAHEQRRSLVDRHRRGGGHDCGAHAPRDQQVGPHIADHPPHVASVTGQLAPGRQALRDAAAQLQRPLAQRDDLHPLGAGPIGQRSLRAGEHQSAGEATGEIEQRALGAAQQAGVCDGQRQHERGD
jgi:hypothetical protein